MILGVARRCIKGAVGKGRKATKILRKRYNSNKRFEKQLHSRFEANFLIILIKRLDKESSESGLKIMSHNFGIFRVLICIFAFASPLTTNADRYPSFIGRTSSNPGGRLFQGRWGRGFSLSWKLSGGSQISKYAKA